MIDSFLGGRCARRCCLLVVLLVLGGIGGCDSGSHRAPTDTADLQAEITAGPDVGEPDTPDTDPDVAELQAEVTPVPIPTTPPKTTLEERIAPLLPRFRQDDSNRESWGKTRVIDGEPYLERDDLAVNQFVEPTGKTPASLTYLMQISDSQLVDTESPMRAAWADNIISVSWRPHEAYSTHLLEMFIRTTNRFSAIYRPFDMVMFTGDNIDNNAYIELKWFLEILEGKEVHPDSGADDDPVPGEKNDPFDRFQSQGLQFGVPWFTVFGNHDGLIVGNVSPVWPNGVLFDEQGNKNDPMRQLINAIGVGDLAILVETLLDQEKDNCGDQCFVFDLTPSEQEIVLQTDPRNLRAIGTWSDFPLPAQATPHQFMLDANRSGSATKPIERSGATVPADPERHFMSKNMWVKSHFGTATKPDGHGFTQQNLTQDTAYWAIDPVPGMPIRLIALNTTSHTVRDGSSEATMDRHQFATFLVPELNKAQLANKLIIVTAHHNLQSFFPKLLNDVFSPPSSDNRDIGQEELRETLHKYSNVVLLLVGHSHYNKVNYYAGETEGSGFWEIITASTLDIPQQSRIVEIVDNRDGTGSIYGTIVDFQGDGSWVSKLAEDARYWGYYDLHNGNGPTSYIDTKADRNVILKFRMPETVRKKLETTYTEDSSSVRQVISTQFPQTSR